MARRTAKQIAASRRNIVKAQRRSAQLRKGTGKSRARKVVKGVAIGGGAIAVGYVAHSAAKEKALKKKHGTDYIPRTAKYSHYTRNNSARRISKTRTMKPTGKNSGYGGKDGVWLTKHRRKGHYDGEVRDMLGKAKVTTRLSRKKILKHHMQTNRNGFERGKDVLHVQVHKSALHNKRMKHNLPKTAKGVRRRHASNRAAGMAGWENTRNMAVSPVRRAAKKKTKRKTKRKKK